MKATFRHFMLLAVLLAFESSAWALAAETLGNEPFHETDYTDFPGIMPVINHPNRVYHRWVNGHEMSYYSGSVEALNDCLSEFGQIGAKVREVLIRPGPPAKVQTFSNNSIEYDWKLELIGGISRHLTTEDVGDKIWSPYPILTVYIDDEHTLKKLQIPDGVELIELSDLKKRYSQGLSSKEHHVRGWGAGRLAMLDPYDQDSVNNVAKLLDDDEDWVRLCAAGALKTFGDKAKCAIPKLQECLKADSGPLRERAKEAIESIEKAKPQTEQEKSHNKLLAEIADYVENMNKS